MEIQDISNILPWTDPGINGGTVLRVLLDFVMDPTMGPLDGDDPDATLFCHLGIGMTDDLTPEQAQWDPNDPHAEFMWRKTWGMSYFGRQSGAPSTHQGVLHNGIIVEADITQKRRIRENYKMWVFSHFFTRLGGAATANLAIGYTGRVLIQLP